jgi:hypothetical protein
MGYRRFIQLVVLFSLAYAVELYCVRPRLRDHSKAQVIIVHAHIRLNRQQDIQGVEVCL